MSTTFNKFFFCFLVLVTLSCNDSGTGEEPQVDTTTTASPVTNDTIEKLDTTAKNYSIKYIDYEDIGAINFTDSAKEVANEISKIKSAPGRKEVTAILRLRRKGAKECLNGKIIKKATRYRIELNGLDLFMKNKKIAGVGSLNLTPQTLNAITEKVVIIDNILYQYCVDLQREYARATPNETIILKLLESRNEWLTKLNNLVSELKEAEETHLDDKGVKQNIDSIRVSPR